MTDYKKFLAVGMLLAAVPYTASARICILGQCDDGGQITVPHRYQTDDQPKQPQQNNDKCSAFKLDTCPENGTCTSCKNKFRLIKCADGYTMSGNSCQLSDKVCDVFNPHTQAWVPSKYPDCGNVGYPKWNGVCWK